jgi:hypothetical protein
VNLALLRNQNAPAGGLTKGTISGPGAERKKAIKLKRLERAESTTLNPELVDEAKGKDGKLQTAVDH